MEGPSWVWVTPTSKPVAQMEFQGRQALVPLLSACPAVEYFSSEMPLCHTALPYSQQTNLELK